MRTTVDERIAKLMDRAQYHQRKANALLMRATHIDMMRRARATLAEAGEHLEKGQAIVMRKGKAYAA